MTKRCLEEAVLQAYIDGELPHEQAAEAAAHLAACDACATALAEAENETSFFAAAFAPDESVSVPTEVLRARIGAAVARLESTSEAQQAKVRGPRFGGLLASLSGLLTFTPHRAAAFASVLAVVAAGVIYSSVQKSGRTPDSTRQGGEIASSTQAPERPSVLRPTPEENVTKAVENVTKTVAAPSKAGAGVAVSKASYVPRRRATRDGESARPTAPSPPKEEALPGEKEYQTAIASLEKTIKMGGDASLRPSLRIEYERNLALLDSAISQTRSVAARNPKDKDAVSFLMAVYQSKVELLTKVADQAQVAALGR